MLALKQLLFYSAALLFASLLFFRFWMRFAWMFLLVFFPPILNMLGLVTKDGLCVPLVFLGYSVALLALQDRATWHASLSAQCLS
jgi:hypothetical protein